jgi:hypothetical protein
VTSRFSKRSPPKKLNLAILEDPLLAQMSAASPLTPPAEETLFLPLDASMKLPDTPMSEQFADDCLETMTLEPEIDVESAHLVTHAKVYAIAEKYVPLFVICPSLFPFPVPQIVRHLPYAIATFVALRCAALRITAEGPRHPATCVTSMAKVPIQSRVVIHQPRHTPAHAFCTDITQSLLVSSRSISLRV